MLSFITSALVIVCLHSSETLRQEVRPSRATAVIVQRLTKGVFTVCAFSQDDLWLAMSVSSHGSFTGAQSGSADTSRS